MAGTTTTANLITLPALASILAIGAGVATIVGGYSYAMVSKANRRADEAELRLKQERERNDAGRQQERERYDQLLDELREERRQSADAQRQAAVAQQQLIASMAEIGTNLARLVEQRQNGRHDDR